MEAAVEFIKIKRALATRNLYGYVKERWSFKLQHRDGAEWVGHHIEDHVTTYKSIDDALRDIVPRMLKGNSIQIFMTGRIKHGLLETLTIVKGKYSISIHLIARDAYDMDALLRLTEQLPKAVCVPTGGFQKVSKLYRIDYYVRNSLKDRCLGQYQEQIRKEQFLGQRRNSGQH